MRRARLHTGLERITVAERERPGGRPASTGVRRDDGRPGRNAGGNRGERVAIGERVRQAHLEHFCPGGAGLPVTDSGPIGLSWVAADPAGWEANAARAAGQRCGRCGQPVTGRQDARKRASGIWVHEACPNWPGPRGGSSATSDQSSGHNRQALQPSLDRVSVSVIRTSDRGPFSPRLRSAGQ